ncbi:hypothetical protein MKX03_004376 [Papaver bracteatum]|nr:hypothetical protein MKX03_004376 [Papaver bracteatum]
MQAPQAREDMLQRKDEYLVQSVVLPDMFNKQRAQVPPQGSSTPSLASCVENGSQRSYWFDVYYSAIKVCIETRHPCLMILMKQQVKFIGSTERSEGGPYIW